MVKAECRILVRADDGYVVDCVQSHPSTSNPYKQRKALRTAKTLSVWGLEGIFRQPLTYSSQST